MKLALVGLGYWGSKVLRNMVTILGPQDVVAVDASSALVEWAAASYPGLTCRATLEDALAGPGGRRRRRSRRRSPATPRSPRPRCGPVAPCWSRSHWPAAPPTPAGWPSSPTSIGQLLMVGHTFLFSPRLDVIRALHRRRHARTDPLRRRCRGSRSGPYRSDVNVIWDLAPHDISILCYLLGEFPATVRTSGRSITRPGSPDVAFMTMEFPSGVVAEVSVSWLAPRKVRNTIIVGDTRMLVYDDMDADEPIKLHDKRFVLPEGDSFGAHQLTYRTGDTVAPVRRRPTSRWPTSCRHFLRVHPWRARAGPTGGSAPGSSRCSRRPTARTATAASRSRSSYRRAGAGRGVTAVVLCVQNLGVPDDPRVWRRGPCRSPPTGHDVTVVAPRTGGAPRRERIDGVDVVRYRSIAGGAASLGQLAEVAAGFVGTACRRAAVCDAPRPIDVLHVANPPDTLFPLGWWLRRTGTRFVYDQHDAAPELAAAKLGRHVLLRPSPALAGAGVVPRRRPRDRQQQLHPAAGHRRRCRAAAGRHDPPRPDRPPTAPRRPAGRARPSSTPA